ncbi:MAG: hypothetical protein ABWY05_06970 [Noviherbaspirillum sp.]
MANTVQAIQGLTCNWNFACSPVPRWRYRQAIELAWKNSHLRPEWTAIKPLTNKSSWTVYFIYAPDGRLTPAHRFTLARLKDSGSNLLVVCATKEAALVPRELHAYADALFWKALLGYDFSAYTLALRQISQQSPGADVLVMNDSVYGPFADLKTCVAQSPWDLTGFTASSKIAHHIQSYAFGLKGVDRLRMLKLAPVFFPVLAISDPKAVILLQEIRLARVASRSMTVGAFWYGDEKDVVDPMLFRPFELIEAGFPFIKRSLLGKHQKFQNPDRVRELLRKLGHLVDITVGGEAS